MIAFEPILNLEEERILRLASLQKTERGTTPLYFIYLASSFPRRTTVQDVFGISGVSSEISSTREFLLIQKSLFKHYSSELRLVERALSAHIAITLAYHRPEDQAAASSLYEKYRGFLEMNLRAARCALLSEE